jgi:Sulfotransferase family/Tetratricopeptide repeat
LLAFILLQLGRIAEADDAISRALALEPGVADAYDSLAYASIALGQHERANMLYRRAVALAPHSAQLWYNLATSERAFGRLDDAESACNHAIALDSTQFKCYLFRSELRVQTQDCNHIDELQTQLTHPHIDDSALMFLGYALAKELDDVQRFDDAFRWFSAAASARRRHLSYDVATDERKLKRIAEVYPSERLESAGPQADSARFIFIIGLPRSGTTLLERILTGLPGVRSNGETDNFSRALLAATAAGAGDVFARAAYANPARIAAMYGALATAGAPARRIIEKLPMNYLYVGAIRRALPQAKIVLVTRSPLDSCFAMYRTLFGQAYPFSYHFGDLARYYAAYRQLVRHWRTTLGDWLHEVTYEDLVKEPARVGSQVARACNLSWSVSAIDIHNNASISRTASASQVRRPIYGSSSGRWRHYRGHLQPLIRELRQLGVGIEDT